MRPQREISALVAPSMRPPASTSEGLLLRLAPPQKRMRFLVLPAIRRGPVPITLPADIRRCRLMLRVRAMRHSEALHFSRTLPVLTTPPWVRLLSTGTLRACTTPRLVFRRSITTLPADRILPPDSTPCTPTPAAAKIRLAVTMRYLRILSVPKIPPWERLPSTGTVLACLTLRSVFRRSITTTPED